MILIRVRRHVLIPMAGRITVATGQSALVTPDYFDYC